MLKFNVFGPLLSKSGSNQNLLDILISLGLAELRLLEPLFYATIYLVNNLLFDYDTIGPKSNDIWPDGRRYTQNSGRDHQGVLHLF